MKGLARDPQREKQELTLMSFTQKLSPPSALPFSLFSVFAIASVGFASGCGPSSEVGGYCDATGCYTCDGYGCSPSEANPSTKASGPAAPASTPAPANNPTGPTPSATCSAHAECGVGKSCQSGACVACGGANGPCPCTEEKECGSGKACVAGACTDKQNACAYTSECDTQNGEVCFNGQCLDSCATTSCDEGKVCQKGACVDNPVTPSCTGNAQCGGDTPVCAGGTCTQACSDDLECGDGRYCNQGACVADTRPSPNCTSDAQCTGSGMAQKCLNGFCKYTCGGDALCRSIDSRIGYCAADSVCRTATEAAPQCTKKSDCTGGRDCVDNQCR